MGSALSQIENGGQPHFTVLLLQIGNRKSQIVNRKSTGGFKRLQRIRHDLGANDDLVCGAHKSAWPRKGVKASSDVKITLVLLD
jgi:hypothetical protein